MTRHVARHITWVLLLLAAVPVAVLADEPTTLPDSSSSPLRPRPRRLERPDGREIDEMNQFMGEHSPNRMAWLKRVRRGGPFFSLIAWGRYRNLREIEKDDHELYEIKLREIKAEDDVFGLLNKPSGPATGGAESDLAGLLRQQIVILVQARFDERQHRIQKMERALEDAKAKLEADRANMDAIVTEKVKALLERPNGAPATRPSTRPAEAEHFGGGPSAPQ